MITFSLIGAVFLLAWPPVFFAWLRYGNTWQPPMDDEA